MKKVNILLALNIVTSIFFLALPYYLFRGKLFIGGDDTRLFYSFPSAFIKNFSFFSWFNVSTIGTNASNQYLLPFLFIWNGLSNVIRNPITLSYLGFSLPLILGLVYFQKAVKELFSLDDASNLEVYMGSLFYMLSPILIINQLFIFLTAVWLLGVIPGLCFYYLKYLKTSHFIYVFTAMLFSLVFSLSMFALPWLFGFLLPLCLGFIVLAVLSSRKEIWIFMKRTAVYIGCLFLTHSFWIFGFIAPYLIKNKNSLSARVISQSVLDTFSPTVLGSAKGSIIYPLLNLFQRQIAFDFSWKLKADFLHLYDKTFIFNVLFLCILFVGEFTYKRYLQQKQRNIFVCILVCFFLSLYFFTVNIGPLKDLFLLFGKIPGFVMFRNFYDKFAPAYVIFYSVLITISLVLFKKKYPKVYIPMLGVFFIMVLINFSPVKSTVNSPLWTTNNTYRTITIPQEYVTFMNDIRSMVPSTNTILSLPFGTSVYTVIKDTHTDNVYVGLSPVKIFSGVNDISGTMSFNFTKEADVFDSLLENRSYGALQELLQSRAINYVLLIKNIPAPVLQSWVFDQNMLDKQDTTFLRAITDKKILTSAKGNYELYTTKHPTSLLESQNLLYKKINAVKYILNIRNIRLSQLFTFRDSYDAGWQLFIEKNQQSPLCSVSKSVGITVNECPEQFRYVDMHELSYLWKSPVFAASHSTNDSFTNTWTIDPNVIKKEFGPDYYTVNPDGSLNLTFVLYYTPQVYFYYGVIVSVVIIVSGVIYVLYSIFKRKKYD